MKRILACLALILGFAVGSHATVSAYLTNCNTTYHPVSGGYGTSNCHDHANNGGNNLQRVELGCRWYQGSTQTNVYFGPYVLEDYTSTVYCPSGYVPVWVDYQLL